MNCNTRKFGGNESWKKLFWMQYNSESICMCWKHKIKTAQCHCGIIFFNVGWNCAALVWASIVANLFLSCNRIFLMSPLHDLPLIIKWHLIRKNSALFQGEFRNSTFLENPSNESNQLVQRWNKYYTFIRALCFWFTMYVCVCYFVNATLQRVFWLSWKNKSENDLQRFVIVYFIFTYKSIFFIKV